MDGDYWEAMIDKGQWREFGQDTGVTPLLFTRSAMGFLMATGSHLVIWQTLLSKATYNWGIHKVIHLEEAIRQRKCS